MVAAQQDEAVKEVAKEPKAELKSYQAAFPGYYLASYPFQQQYQPQQPYYGFDFQRYQQPAYFHPYAAYGPYPYAGQQFQQAYSAYPPYPQYAAAYHAQQQYPFYSPYGNLFNTSAGLANTILIQKSRPTVPASKPVEASGKDQQQQPGAVAFYSFPGYQQQQQQQQQAYYGGHPFHQLFQQFAKQQQEAAKQQQEAKQENY